MKRDVVPVSHPIVQKKINKGLDLSIREGAVTSVSTNSSLSYFSPAALALNASSVQMGILYAITNLLPNLVQLKTASLIERIARKKIVLTGIIGKILLVLPILLVGFLHWMGVPYMIWVFIGLVGLHYVFTAISHPAWFSWMGSLAPEAERGNYFSKRNRVVGFFGVLTMILGALFLDKIKSFGAGGDVVGYTLIGFGVIFVLSGIFRTFSWDITRKIYEPRLKLRKKDKFSFEDFLRSSMSTPFGRFSIFAGVFTFVSGIAMPYWSVYMIRDLGWSYFWYVMVIVSGVIFQLVFLPLLGKFSDRFGNIRLMQTCSVIIGIAPLLWVLSVFIQGDLMVKVYLLAVPSVVSGFGWAGYNLALNNYVYDSVSNRKQSFGVSYMNLLVGAGGFFGAGFGAFLAWLNVSFMNPILFIFLVSGIGRLFVGYFGSRSLHEVRNVKKFTYEFWIRELAPLQGVVREVHNLENLVQKVEHFVVPEDGEELLVENR